MVESLENRLAKIPVISQLMSLFKKIKLPGLKGLSLFDLIDLYVTGIVKGAISARAGAIAYSFFMAIFPFLLFFITVIPYIPIDGFHEDFLVFLESILPPQTSDFFYDNIFKDLESRNQNSGLISSVFLLSIILMANGVNAVFSGFERSYHEQLTRNFVRQYFYALGIALILGFLIILAVAGLGVFEIYLEKTIETLDDYGIKTTTRESSLFVTIARYVFFVVLIYMGTATLYYFGTKEGRSSKFFSVGAFFTTLLIIVTSYLFGIYIDNFANYNKLYGSIGALLILMFYVWLNSNILLLGFELNMSLNKLKKQNL